MSAAKSPPQSPALASLHRAAEKNDADCVSELLAGAGAAAVTALDKDGLTPLHRAAAGNACETALILLARRAPVDAVSTTDQETPLHLAADSNAMAVALQLIRGGANVNAVNAYGKTPRDVAEERGFMTFAAVLQPMTKVGMLHYAARDNVVRLVKVLLEEGSDPNAPDPGGATPLHWATASGALESVKILLLNKADPLALDRFGHTPMSVAERSPALKAIHALLTAKALETKARPKSYCPAEVEYMELSHALFDLFPSSADRPKARKPQSEVEYASIDPRATAELQDALRKQRPSDVLLL